MSNNYWRRPPKPASFCRGRFQIEMAADEYGENVGPIQACQADTERLHRSAGPTCIAHALQDRATICTQLGITLWTALSSS